MDVTENGGYKIQYIHLYIVDINSRHHSYLDNEITNKRYFCSVTKRELSSR